jgi:hypothetical protein
VRRGVKEVKGGGGGGVLLNFYLCGRCFRGIGFSLFILAIYS